MTLPPMPDRNAGEPRPPQAPVALDWKNRATTDAGAERVPPAPAGVGPALEWFHKQGVRVWQTSLVIVGVLAVVYTVVTLSFEWVTVWWLWLLFLIGPIYGLSIRRGYWCIAGADWFLCDDVHVKTYELSSVAITGGAVDLLELKDTHGHEMAPDLEDVQANQALWDLVYNGILHSVYRGGAATNERARLLLQLGEARHDVAE